MTEWLFLLMSYRFREARDTSIASIIYFLVSTPLDSIQDYYKECAMQEQI
jgi:hypothetical protein